MNALAEFQFALSRNLGKGFVRVKNRPTIDKNLPNLKGHLLFFLKSGVGFLIVLMDTILLRLDLFTKKDSVQI